MIIIGAGLAGLLAGNIFQRAHIFERGPEDQLSHRAVLRFRSRAVGEAVGIDFREVTVHRGIWLGDKFVRPSIQLANTYSRKVIGRYMDRSIWNMAPAQRFVAPENIVEQLAERCTGRISWGTAFESGDCDVVVGDEDIISTIPMPALLGLLGTHSIVPPNVASMPEFQYKAITVRRWRIKGCDTFQTIYFPDPSIPLYRASITGDLLIAEFVSGGANVEEARMLWSAMLCAAFGIEFSALDSIDTTQQRFGKIAPVDDAWRRQTILWATMSHRIFSLGRFAIWRNILLDDVLHDISVIKRLIRTGAYDAARNA